MFKSYRVFFCFYFVILVQNNLFAQSVDSLNLNIKNAKHDSTKCNYIIAFLEKEENDSIIFVYLQQLESISVKNISKRDTTLKNVFLRHLAFAYNDYGIYYGHKSKYLLSKQYYEKSIVLLQKLKIRKGVAATKLNLGTTYQSIGDIPLAVQCMEQSLSIYQSDSDFVGTSYCLNTLGFLYRDQGNLNKSLDYFFRSLLIREKSGDEKGTATSYNNIASMYQLQGDYKSALIYFKKSLVILEKLNLLYYQAACLNNIGVLYVKMNKYDLALDSYNKSLKIHEAIGSEVGIASIYKNLGGLYEAKNEEEKAIQFYRKSLLIFEQGEDKKLISKVLLSIAELILKKGDYSKAIQYSKKSFEFGNELGIPEIIQSAAHTLTKAYKYTNNNKEALKYYEVEVQMRDSLFNLETKKESVKKIMLYEFEKKELETKILQDKKLADLNLLNEKAVSRKNKLVIALIFFVLFLVITIYYLFNLYKQRNIINANKNNELKQKLLLSQMNPHFIFNSVDNIQSLIHNNQNKEAINYLTKFSKLTRQILQNSTENYISLDEEVAMLDNYLTIQKLLYNNNFTFKINVDESIDKEYVLVPPMLTQPFIENAIKHGLKHTINNGLIQIYFYMKNNLLYFEVIDNGSGIENKKNTSDHKSLATQIVKERLNNKSSKKTIEIIIENIYDNNNVVGVRTLFEIPYIYNS